MTSTFSTFADTHQDLISARAYAAILADEGMSWGDSTIMDAVADMGAEVIGILQGRLLCELSDRLFLVTSVGGPYAVEVATQEDLAL